MGCNVDKAKADIYDILTEDQKDFSESSIKRTEQLAELISEKLDSEIKSKFVMSINDKNKNKLDEKVNEINSKELEYRAEQIQEGNIRKIQVYKNNKMIESNNLKEKDLFEYNGFDCKVLGMFYKDKENEKIFNYTPQVNLILSPNNYIVCKPNDEIKNIIVNHKMIKAAFKEDFNIFELGLFKETESEVFTNESRHPTFDSGRMAADFLFFSRINTRTLYAVVTN